MKKRHLLSLLALGISTACYGETYPAPIGPSQSDFGGVGLLQTPTARMAREGELSLNYRDNDQYRYYSASVQLFPWLETTLRYTDVRTRQYSSVEAFSGDQTYKDMDDFCTSIFPQHHCRPEHLYSFCKKSDGSTYPSSYVHRNCYVNELSELCSRTFWQ